MSTTFLDYNAQIQNLQKQNLIIDNESISIEILSKISYYGLINGYKNVFKDPVTNKYIAGTTFNDIY